MSAPSMWLSTSCPCPKLPKAVAYGVWRVEGFLGVVLVGKCGCWLKDSRGRPRAGGKLAAPHP